MHQIEPESDPPTTDDDSLYPYANNNIEYGLFEDIVDSYYLDGQIKDDFQCNQDCYSQHRDPTNDDHPNVCTHDYHHIMQNIQDLTDNTQQNNLHSMEECASSFTDDTDTHCDYAKFFCLFLLWLCIKYIVQLWGMLQECTLGSYRVLCF